MVRRSGPLAVIIGLLLYCPVTEAEPVSASITDIRGYVAVMKPALADAGVRVLRIDSPDDTLLIDYEVTDDATRPEFAMGAVLRLAEPLTDDARKIRVRNVQDGRRLMQVEVPLGQLQSVIAATVSEAQAEQIDRIYAEVLEACGIELPPAPVAEKRDGESDTPVTVAGREDVAIDTAGDADDAQAQTPEAVEADTAAAELRMHADVEALAGELCAVLIDADLENVAVGLDAEGLWIIEFENRTYRSDIDALDTALQRIADVLPPSHVLLRLKRHDVAVSHIRLHLADYARLRAGILSPESLARRWEVRSGPGVITGPVHMLAGGNHSHGRTDLLFRPGISYQIGLESGPFQSDYFIVGEARATLGRGLSTNLRFPTQVTSTRRTELDRALLTWVGQPNDEVLATGSFGQFREDLFGYYGEVQLDRGEHRFGMMGSLVRNVLRPSPFDNDARGFGYYEYDWGGIGLKSRIGWGRFHESGETGFALSLQRRFRESVIEARAVRSDEGEEGLAFGLSIPFGPTRASPPEDLRLRTDTAFSANYVSDFLTQGDYLQGPYDLDSFRGELSSAYLRHRGERLADIPRETSRPDWPVAPSFEGISGLLRIPTADVAPDGRAFTGISYMDRTHSKVRAADSDAMPVFLGFGFLPNLEMTGVLTFMYDVKAFDWSHNLDRSMNVHLRLNEQRGDWFPALAVGMQDVSFGTRVSYIGDGEYVVGTLQQHSLRMHLGAGRGRYSPLFAGLDMRLPAEPKVHLLADYDSRYINTGVRLFLDDWGSATLGLLGGRQLTGSVSFHTDLHELK